MKPLKKDLQAFVGTVEGVLFATVYNRVGNDIKEIGRMRL